MKDTVCSLTLSFVMLFSSAFTNPNSLKKNNLFEFFSMKCFVFAPFFFILLFKKCVFRQKMGFFGMGLSLPGLYSYRFFHQTTQFMWAFHCHSAVLAWLIICFLTGTIPPCLFCPLCSNADTYPHISFYESSLYVIHWGIYNKLPESKSLIKVNLSLLLPSWEYFFEYKTLYCHSLSCYGQFTRFQQTLCICLHVIPANRKSYRTRLACFLSFTE